MAWRPHGRARVNPQMPEGFATCDRCSFLYNLHDLVWQHEWRGPTLQNTWFRVCTVTCLDSPAAFLKTIVLPADPMPLYQPRPEPYEVDEAGGGSSNPTTWDSGGFWDVPGEVWDA